MKHVMIDLETLGNKPGCVILSIGACYFDPKDSDPEAIGNKFYMTVRQEPQIDRGMHVDSETYQWWMKQNAEAWEAATRDPSDPKDVVDRFYDFWFDGGGVYPWSHGASFDLPIIEWLFRAMKRSRSPWRFHNQRDTRTVLHMAKCNTKSIKREGTHHNALDDAVHQARLMKHAVSKIRID